MNSPEKVAFYDAGTDPPNNSIVRCGRSCVRQGKSSPDEDLGCAARSRSVTGLTPSAEMVADSCSEFWCRILTLTRRAVSENRARTSRSYVSTSPDHARSESVRAGGRPSRWRRRTRNRPATHRTRVRVCTCDGGYPTGVSAQCGARTSGRHDLHASVTCGARESLTSDRVRLERAIFGYTPARGR